MSNFCNPAYAAKTVMDLAERIHDGEDVPESDPIFIQVMSQTGVSIMTPELVEYCLHCASIDAANYARRENTGLKAQLD
ncbi:hypothetical protein BGX23_010043 [Mortierella sp. AD031]|nr:hypothetical protein BGX23_010043 [Mortierella sp. AD031]KAG0201470.1 hypothetical protein BGX33_010312 [Mortierella sp. NVP41]